MPLRFNFLSIQEEVNDILFILNLVLPIIQINTNKNTNGSQIGNIR